VPREPPDAGRGINDVSVVFLGEVAGRRFLLTGDVEDDVDPRIADRELPPVDILKVAHHGSATASTPAFLDRVLPKVAVVSAGAGNPYGHPARSTIDRLRATGADVLRTDTDGSVAITISPSGAIGVATTGSRSARLGREALAELTLARDVLAAATSSDRDDADAELPRTNVTTAASRELGRGPRITFACGIPSNG
jgi:hypothetical protein